MDLGLYPLFEGMPAADLAAVARRLEPRDIRHLQDDEVLFRQGDEAMACYLLERGEVRLAVNGVTYATARGPQTIGERALVSGSPRSATAIVKTPGPVVELRREVFVALLGESTVFAGNVARLLADKLGWALKDKAASQASASSYYSILRNHMPKEAVDALYASEMGVKGPRRLERCVVLFADVANYSGLTRDVEDPTTIADELSEYFAEMCRLIHGYGGVVNSFLGDGILAFWGFPSWSDAFPGAALECALEMRRGCGAFSLGSGRVVNRIGLAMGPVFCGVVGKEPVQRFTILGPVVNLAARLEQANKKLDTAVLVRGPEFQATLAALPASLLDEYDPPVVHRLRLKGFDGRVGCLGFSYRGDF
ncbi:MAG: adenylate/guanylate cyclase domain-containing protein [Pseudomonadota bacterium]